MKKRSKKSSSVMFYVLLVMIVMLAVTNFLTSGLYARYLSSGSGNDDGRVARWDINFDDGGELDTEIPSTHLEYGSKGEYGLDIVNSSETLARIANDSKVKLRLYSPNLNLEHHHDSWDFLEDNNHQKIDNPINFRAYLYNCSFKNLNENYLENGVFVPKTDSDVEEYVILDTADDVNPLKFKMVIEDGTFYYETVATLDDLTDKFNLDIDGGRICLRVVWDVAVVQGDVVSKENFISNHMVKVSEYDNSKFVGILDKSSLSIKNGNTSENVQYINLQESNDYTVQTTLGNNSLTINGEKYVIAYKEHDYFEYLIYTSSLGGEVMITFDDVEGMYIKRSTKLSNLEKESLKSRVIENVNTVEDLSRFIEKLEYASFYEFLDVKSQYEQTTGYVNLGIECRIILNLKVEQVD